MRGVLVEVPEALLAERHQLGIDVFDEMWEGELHMVPPPSEEHQRVGIKLVVALEPVAESSGLLMRYETGVFDPRAEGESSYRTPDLVVFAPEHRSRRGVEGRAALVVEIRSPGDETLDKLRFYEQVGVAEVLVVDRDNKEVRRWGLSGGTLEERDPPPDGWQVLDALPVRLRGQDGTLFVEGPHGSAII